jgi:hypothetical protein
MEEMLDDTMNLEEDEEVEEEADEEVDKVLFELTNGKLGQVGTVDTQLPVSTSFPGEYIMINGFLIGCSGRRGAGREGNGTIQGTTERFTQWIEYVPERTTFSGIRGVVSSRVCFLGLDNVN